MTRLKTAFARIDADNARDPNRVEINGHSRPAEEVYGERMSAVLDRLYPEASEILQVAVRAQHLRRFEIPRASYPIDRTGYLRWRNDLKRKHAEWAGDIMAEVGYSAEEIDRARALIRKENLQRDSEAQALEDTAAVVFLEFYALDFAPKHDHDKVVSILAKTMAKMSAKGRNAALSLPMPDALKSLVTEAAAAYEAKSKS